jgi:hypothetical protein
MAGHAYPTDAVAVVKLSYDFMIAVCSDLLTASNGLVVEMSSHTGKILL